MANGRSNSPPPALTLAMTSNDGRMSALVLRQALPRRTSAGCPWVGQSGLSCERERQTRHEGTVHS